MPLVDTYRELHGTYCKFKSITSFIIGALLILVSFVVLILTKSLKFFLILLAFGLFAIIMGFIYRKIPPGGFLFRKR